MPDVVALAHAEKVHADRCEHRAQPDSHAHAPPPQQADQRHQHNVKRRDERIFARQVEALGSTGDVLVAVSTSGNSANVLAAVAEAKSKGIKTIGMTAAGGGKMAEVCDVCLVIPDKVTARAQEVHGLIGHILCEIVEE